MKAENDGSRDIGLPKSDGVCSRVAPYFSSKSTSAQTTPRNGNFPLENRDNAGDGAVVKNKFSLSHFSTCSTSTSDDQDENYMTESSNITKRLIHKQNQNNINRVSKSNTSTAPTPSRLEQGHSYNNNHDNNETPKESKSEGKSVHNEAGKEYDSGLELSSPENSSSSSVPCSGSNTEFITTPVTNANNNSKDFVNSSSYNISNTIITSDTTTTTPLVPETTTEFCSVRDPKKKHERPALPKLITNDNINSNNSNLYSKYINSNPDDIVIAAPLSITPHHLIRGCEGKESRCDSNLNRDDEKYEPSSSSALSSKNNSSPTSPSIPTTANSSVQSVSSMPSFATSMDERDHAEISDPQRYARYAFDPKYYQFGVVFDTSDDPDQGIDTAAEEEDSTARKMDSLEDMTLDSRLPTQSPSPSSSPPPINTRSITLQARTISAVGVDDDNNAESRELRHSRLHSQQKNANDFLAVMMQRNRKLARKAKKSGNEMRKEQHNSEDVLVSKSIYLQEEDEEIGTFDPKAVLESRLRRGSSNAATFSDEDGDAALAAAAADEDTYYLEDTRFVASPVTSASAPVPLSMSHLYVNPFSLAAEMSGSVMVKAGPTNVGKKRRSVVNEDDSFDSSSSSSSSTDEPPLPPYESPTSVEIPVYSTNTPAARVIRQNLSAIGDPVSGAICCSIQ